MKRVRRLVLPLTMAMVIASAAHAQGLAASGNDGPLAPTPDTSAIALTQRLGAALPLAAPFTDSAGRAIALGDEFASVGRDARPVIVVLGYYRCPQLCGLLMHGLLEAAHDTGLPATSWRLVFVSIDPDDTPADAAVRRRVEIDYARFLDAKASPPDVDLLVGPPASVRALAYSIGYAWQPAAAAAPAASGAPTTRFDHPAGLVVCTPDGRVSHYLMGVRFDPRDLRAALVDASGGRVGTLTDRLALLCAHLDPHAGRWSTAVLAGLRAVGFATMVMVGLLLWRSRARERSA